MATAIRITMFGGIIPRLADRGLPENAAQLAVNAKLYSGELRAWSRLRALDTLPISNAKTVFHYRYEGADRYLSFDTLTHVVKAPLINETLGRLYWTNDFGPQINTTARIELGNPAFKLGVPSPGSSFSVTASGGTDATAESRVYVATLVSTYGEESEPSLPVLENGNADGTWTVDGLDAMIVDLVNYPNIEKLRLYRTITSATGVDYRQVDEWDVGSRPATYDDTKAATDLSSAFVMQSLTWGPPPPDTLRGLVAVAGGFMAGFHGRTVRLSVPYQPHAWPEDYQFAVEDNIVGLGTFGNTIVVCTEGRPYLLIGPSPDAMSLVKCEGVQPCLSARSIVSTSNGVLFATTDGLVIIDGSTNKGSIISRAWVTKDEWMSRFNPPQQMAAVYQDRYFAFYSSQLGFTIGFDDPVTGFTELQYDGVTSVDLDTLTGQTLVTIGNTVYEWDGDSASALVYTWRSKPFLQPKPVNFGALQLRGSFVGSSATLPLPPAQGIGGFSLNSQQINGAADPEAEVGVGGTINGPPTWMALGIAPTAAASGPEVAVKIYADGVLRSSKMVNSEMPRRLPSGFKATKWEVEVQGVSPLFSVALADTLKTLEQLP